jgi:multiple sugar transport system ATP-binding protein
MSQSDVRLRAIQKSYGKVHVIHGVDLDIEPGEFTVFVGPSGCGKTTLLRMIAGLEEISSGTLTIGGESVNDLPPSDRGVAMVFQSYALYPHKTVFDNMAFALKIAKLPKAEIEQRVNAAADILQLREYLQRLPKALSGGQRQRVAIGRAIVRNPKVFLFDEPLSNLDAALRTKMRVELATLHRSLGATMIYVTHDQVEAMTLADRILLLHTGDDVKRWGSVAQVGSPMDLFHRPKSRFVAGFIGSTKMNFLPGVLLSASPALARVRLHGGTELDAAVDATALSPGAAVTLGIRPEHTRIGPQGQHLVGPMQWQERLGDSTDIHVAWADGQAALVARASGLHAASHGQRLAVTLPADQLHLFDADSRAMPRCVDLSDQALPTA